MLADCHNVSDLQNLVSRVRPHIPEQPCSLQCNKPSQQCISCPLIARDLLTPSFRIRAPPYICNPAPPPSPNQASCSPAANSFPGQTVICWLRKRRVRQRSRSSAPALLCREIAPHRIAAPSPQGPQVSLAGSLPERTRAGPPSERVEGEALLPSA